MFGIPTYQTATIYIKGFRANGTELRRFPKFCTICGDPIRFESYDPLMGVNFLLDACEHLGSFADLWQVSLPANAVDQFDFDWERGPDTPRIHRGINCVRCDEHFPYGEPNHPSGTLTCWSCRTTPHYRSEADDDY